jgi:DNA invertase Pin-like site-specific DNA recombinase
MGIIAYLYQETTAAQPDWGPWAGRITQIYTDIAIAAEPSYRPHLAQLLTDNRATPAQVVLVQDFSALGDSLESVQTSLTTLTNHGSQVISLQHPDQTPGDNLVLGHTLAEQQRRRRLRAGHAQSRLKALPPPGRAPYGYRRGQERYLVDRSAAPVITAFVNEFLLYGSLRGAVRFVDSRFGKRISVSTGRRWLTHPVYRGDLQYRDGAVLRDTHGAIISRDEAAQIDRLLRRNSQLPPRTAGAPRSLAGLVHCQECGCPLVISKTTIRKGSKSYLYLRPQACGRPQPCAAIPYGQALDQIIVQICQDLPQAVTQRFASGTAPSPNPWQEQLEQKQSAVTQLPDLVARGVLDTETADLRRYKLRSEIADLHQRLAQLPPVNLQELSQSVSIPQFWHDLSETERRFFFREFIQAIAIVRAGKTWAIALTLVF